MKYKNQNKSMKPGLVMLTHDSSTWKQVRGHPGLHGEFETSLNYIARSCLRKIKIKNEVSREISKNQEIPGYLKPL
jgi:hypothetical protein